MDNKEIIIQTTIDLINEKDEQMDGITVRKKANVGLGLVNYHFGNKDKLIELCVERIVNGIIDNFQTIREKTERLNAFEKLEYLAYLPLMSACRPDWDEKTLKRKTFYLISVMQQSFLRHKVIMQFYGIDLTVPEERKAFHEAVLHDILEV